MALLRGIWFLGRVALGLVLGAFIGLLISDYVIRSQADAGIVVQPLDAQSDSP
ncbi:MAG: hypothetical protein AAGA15_11265 [Pseudomonadota bacterium]